MPSRSKSIQMIDQCLPRAGRGSLGKVTPDGHRTSLWEGKYSNVVMVEHIGVDTNIDLYPEMGELLGR